MRFHRLYGAACCAVVLAACSGGDGPVTPPQPAAVRVEQDSVVLRQQETGTLNVTVTDASGRTITGATVAWSSSVPEVAQVDAQGRITTGRPGVTVITATAGAVHDSATVRVAPVWKSVATGTFAGSTCALAVDGSAFCWGNNFFGVLGDGTTEPGPVPVRVTGIPTLVKLTVGLYTACGLAADGKAYCWGQGRSGELGDGTHDIRGPGAPVVSSVAFVDVAAGQNHVCARTADGTAYCWGLNDVGQVGSGDTTRSYTTPVAVAGGLKFTRLAVGALHTCGIAASGDAYCWGWNTVSQLGTGTLTNPVFSPARVAGPQRLVDVAPGYTDTCGVDAAGQIFCWGVDYGIAPTPYAPELRLASISLGFQHVCGITLAGAAWCWGGNYGGELGVGMPADGTHREPRQVPNVPALATIVAGYYRTCATTTAGELYCWGDNRNGELGVGDTDQHLGPVKLRDPL